jgi:diguanylate cyclase (GGDEF)-like protein
MRSGLVLFFAGAVIGLLVGRLLWVRTRRRGASPTRPETVSTNALPLTPALPPRESMLNAVEVLRGDDRAVTLERDAGELSEVVRPLLRDVAQQHGAREVTLWRQGDPSSPQLEIIAWSGAGDAPSSATWGTQVERSLVSWSAAERMVGFERRDGEPRVAIGPVKYASGEAIGAMVLVAEERFTSTRDALRDWLPRHAVHVESLIGLFARKNEVARQNKMTRALLRIAQELQKAHVPGELEEDLCRYAIEVTSADFALLVRWDAAARSGAVSAATEGTPTALSRGGVEASSVVGAACIDVAASFWADASYLEGRGGVLREEAEGLPPISLMVLPLRRGDVALGALVIGDMQAGALRTLEIRNGTVLTVLAVNALEASWQSRTDALTGLWNRRHFDEQFERVLAETDRFGGSSTLVICDIDFFKKVNDTYGHDAGDSVLRQVSAVLRNGVRTVDICARLGGEEFALILPQTALDGATELAERLRARIEALTVEHGGVTLRVTISVGVATYAAGASNKQTLFKRADQLLYEAKRGGRNRVVS